MAETLPTVFSRGLSSRLWICKSVPFTIPGNHRIKINDDCWRSESHAAGMELHGSFCRYAETEWFAGSDSRPLTIVPTNYYPGRHFIGCSVQLCRDDGFLLQRSRQALVESSASYISAFGINGWL